MSLNSSHTPNCNGVILFSGERILMYCSNVHLKFKKTKDPCFKKTKKGVLYLTTHRIIFKNKNMLDLLISFSMPFVSMKNVTLEQPLLFPINVQGIIEPLPDGNFDTAVYFKLSFPNGGCIEFGRALAVAVEMAARTKNWEYSPTSIIIHQISSAPETCFTQGYYQGFQAPVAHFPEHPPALSTFVTPCPPPYPGISQSDSHSHTRSMSSEQATR
ncbi:unnamed protein product [Caenorhabditis bovis]|uniref:GRAM domain-containing protein n=1 Tax=Caenorhabditis bovis TaxID=2654633 RepID=A0A8S1F4X6_9PELO|nr:unnamed protein product [Caenorhabditis bovis]